MKHLLVTTDFSDEAKPAFTYAKQFADAVSASDVRITVLFILEDLQMTSVNFSFGLAMIDAEGVLEKARTKAREHLDVLVEKQFSGYSAQGEIVEGMNPVHRMILDFSKEHGVDAIVMATHGRTGLSHALIGSITEKVVRESKVPVIVVPSKS